MDSEEITVPVYATFAALGILLVIGHYFLLPMFCDVTDMSELVVKIHLLRAKIALSRRRLKNQLANLKHVQSTMPYRLEYGIFGFIRKEFLPEYYEVLIERVFDAIMLQ